MRQAFVVVCILGLSQICHADPQLPKLFSDHMVLQQHRAIHVWGKGNPSETISVSLLNQTTNTTADESGHWSLDLAAMPAGGPFTLTVQGKTKVIIKDVMIGEVWFCSGQSNMEMPIAGWGRINNYQQEIAAANFDAIRQIKVPNTVALVPQTDIPAVILGTVSSGLRSLNVRSGCSAALG